MTTAGSLAGKVAIVTGAGAGIGRGIALALAREGASVAVVERDPESMVGTVDAIAQRGDPVALPVRCDVGELDQIQAAVAATVERFGTVDVLVNNAQTFRSQRRYAPLHEIDDDDARVDFESGPLGTLRFMRLCHEHLVGDGCVVNVVSAGANTPDPSGVGVYAAAKAAVVMLTRAAAVEWGHEGIRVNAIAPLALSAKMEANLASDPAKLEHFVSKTALGRLGDCEADIGRAVVFLCGPDASYITGTVLGVDGGISFPH